MYREVDYCTVLVVYSTVVRTSGEVSGVPSPPPVPTTSLCHHQVHQPTPMMGCLQSSLLHSDSVDIVRPSRHSLVRYWLVTGHDGGWWCRWQLGWGGLCLISSDSLSLSLSVTLPWFAGARWMCRRQCSDPSNPQSVSLLISKLQARQRERDRLTWNILAVHICVKYKY